MDDVLVATLGDSPVVVTATVKALRELKGISVRTLHVLYPALETQRLIELGYDIIFEHLRAACEVRGCPLPFADCNSYETSMQFLRKLADVLDDCERSGDTVHLSLAGGRKNMSALLAVISQFYPCVRGLYHLLDRYEEDERKRSFYTIEALVDEPNRDAKLNPPAGNLKLVEIPYAHFARASEIRRYFATADRGEDFVLPTSGAADAFFSPIFQGQTEPPLEVYLSRSAFEEYEKLGPQIRRGFDHCFQRMTNARSLERHKHGKFGGRFETDCLCFKMGDTAERPFYYRQDNRVVVCRLTLHGSTYEALIDGGGSLWKADHPPVKPLSRLHEEEAILLVPLGESPMVATQTYILLEEHEGWRVPLIALLYPGRHAPSRCAAELVADACERRKIRVEKRPIPALKDVDSYEACLTYLEELMRTIDDLRRRYPQRSVALSLSGGRKGMSALALFAAERAGIDWVYHTLVTDPVLEDQVERECSPDKLTSLTSTQRAERLFLNTYDRSKFTLFRIPVISVK